MFIVMNCLGCGSSTDEPQIVPPPGTWSVISNHSYTSVGEGVSFQIGKYVYCGLGLNVLGGNVPSSGIFFKSSDGYNWERIALYPGQARIGAVSFVLHGKAYVGTGGRTQHSTGEAAYYKDFWCYDPTTDQWSEAAEFIGTERKGAVAFTIAVKGKGENGEPGDMAFVGCGSSRDEFLNDFYSFDGTNWEKVKLPPIGSRRFAGTAFVINNVAYICGGYKYYDKMAMEGDPEYAKDMVYYMGAPNDMWGVLKNGFNNDSLPRVSPTSFVAKRKGEEKGYLLFGTSSDANRYPFYNKTFWEFSPESKQWLKLPSIPEELKPRGGAISFNIGNAGCVAFGMNGSTQLYDVWKFTPED